VQIVVSIALALIIYLAVRQAYVNQATVGDFVSFLSALLLIFQPMKRLTGVNQSLQRGLAAAENVFRLIDEKSESDSGTSDILRAKGEIEFRQVGFTYPGATRPAIDRVSFSIHSGETVALVGSSGAGKTTLANLLPRFYSPDSGQILLDGIDIATLKLASLRWSARTSCSSTTPSQRTSPTAGSPEPARPTSCAPPRRRTRCNSSARCPTDSPP
jgi:subfamily B ATP-binding cassette protein MsbA